MRCPRSRDRSAWLHVLVITSVLSVALCVRLAQARSTVDEAALHAHTVGLWQIAAQGKLTRWIEIHNLAEAERSGVYHIEVLGRVQGKPRHALEHVQSHMAITRAALLRSVQKPLKTGAVYPESFDGAHARWLALPASERRVCDQSVVACLGS